MTGSTGQEKQTMQESRSPSPALRYTGATVNLPAWLWQAIANAQRYAGHDSVPVVIAQVGLRKFMILNVDDWCDVLAPLDTPHNPASHASSMAGACQSGRIPCDTRMRAFGSP